MTQPESGAPSPKRVPSPDEIAAARTALGAWTREQLAEWGIPWPPPKGWKRELGEKWRAQEAEARMPKVMDVAPVEWDRGAGGLAAELARLLGSVKDAGTNIDTGMGDGVGDLWVTVSGIEYFITIRKSNKQQAQS